MFGIRVSLVGLMVFLCANVASAGLVLLDKAPDSAFPTGIELNAIAGGTSVGPLDFTTITTPPTLSVLPAMGTLTATHPSISPTATATHTYMLEPDFSSGPAFFDHTFSDFLRSSTLDQRATAEAHIEFKVDTPAIYTIDGLLSVEDAGASFGKVEMEVALLDITAGTGSPITVFASSQTSVMTTDQTFFVGGADGDDSNSGFGSPVGLLDPSKRYAWKFLVNTLAISTTTESATAEGKLTLSVTSATSVPEPNSLGALGLASILTCWRSSRRNRKSL